MTCLFRECSELVLKEDVLVHLKTMWLTVPPPQRIKKQVKKYVPSHFLQTSTWRGGVENKNHLKGLV